MKENENKKNDIIEEEEDGPEIFTLLDEEGKEIEFESLGSLEHKGSVYYALVPVSDNDEISSEEYVILKVAEEDGEQVFITIDDDDEFDEVADIFDDEFNNIDYDPQA